MKAFLIGVAAVLGLVLLALVVGPHFIDWNQYKGEITRRAEEATGRRLAIAGDLSLSLLPTPALAAEDVRLASVPGASAPDMATIEELKVRVRIAPLLRGRVEVESIVLNRPVLILETTADGQSNWVFKPTAGTAPDTASGVPQETAAGGGPDIALDDVRVEDGVVVVRDATGVEQRYTDIDAQLAARSLQGPLSVRGSVAALGHPIRFDLSVGLMADDRPTPISAAVANPDGTARLSFSGTVADIRSAPRAAGRLSAEAADLRALPGTAGLPPSLAGQKFTAEGAVTASQQEVAVNDIALRLGDASTDGMSANGAVTVDLRKAVRADMVLSMNRLDLDRLLGDTKAGAPPKAAAPPRPANGKPMSAAPGAGGFSLPSGVTATMEVNVEGIIYRDGLIRQARLMASLQDGRVALKQAQAFLPGGTELSLTGTLAAAQGKPSFEGSLDASSDNLRATLGWLDVDVDAVPVDRLRVAALSSDVRATPEQVELAGLDLRVDTSRLTGGIVAALRERPAYGVNLVLDQLNLDAYRAPGQPTEGQGAANGKPAQATAGVFPALGALDGFDANFRLRAQRLTLNQTPIQDVRLAGTLAGGRLTLREGHVGDMAGATAAASGEAHGFGGTPVLEQVTLKANVPDVNRLSRAFDAGAPAPERLGPVAVEANATGPLDALDLKLNASVAGGTAAVAGTVDALGATKPIALTVEAKHPSLAVLLQRLGIEGAAPAKALPVALSGRVTRSADAVAVDDFKLSAGPSSLTGSARLDRAGPRPKLVAKAVGTDLDLDPFLGGAGGDGNGASGNGGKAASRPSARPGEMWSREPFDTVALRGFDATVELAANEVKAKGYTFTDPTLTAALDDGVLDLSRFAAGLFGGSVEARGRLDAAQEVPRFELTAGVREADVQKALFDLAEIDLARGVLTADTALAGAGRSPADLVARLDGTLAVSVRDGVIKGFDLPAASARLGDIDRATDLLGLLQAGLTGGETPFSSLAGSFAVEKGVARTEDLRLVAEAGEASGRGAIDLPRWLIDMLVQFRLTEHPSAPPMGLKLQGSLDNPRKILDLNKVQAWLVQRGVGRLLDRTLRPRSEQPAPSGGDPAGQGTARQEAAEPPKPEDVLRGLLKGLTR